TAFISIDGTAQGVENGALAKLTVSATVRFDMGTRRIVGVVWRQTDIRDQGPATPAAELETLTTFKRELLAQPPAELGDAAVAAADARASPSATPHTTP